MPNRDIVCGSLRSISTFFPDIFPIIPHCSDSPSHPMVIDSDSLLGSEAIFFSFINSSLISSFLIALSFSSSILNFSYKRLCISFYT